MKSPKFYETFGTNLSHQREQFFNNSTLHGVRYFAEKGRALCEKFMWFCFIATGAVAAFVIIGSLWEKFQTNPTITGLDTEFHNTYLDFPTITVCPFEPFNVEKVYETAMQTIARYEPGFEVYIPLLEMMPKLSYDAFNQSQFDELIAVFNQGAIKSNLKLHPLRNLIFKIAMNCTELFHSCQFSGETFNCCEKFKASYSEHGFCYSFNGRYYRIKNTNISKLLETDTNRAIRFVLNHPSKVYVHSIEEVFSYDTRPQFQWDVNFSIDLLITMKQTYTTNDTKQLSVAQRKCVFQGEETLNYYDNDMYSSTACMKECRMKKAMRLCKCVPPFYTSPSVSKYPKCWITNLACLQQNQKEITSNEGCHQCQLSCLSTVYESERFKKNLVKFGADNVTAPLPEDFYINIGFLAWPIIRYKREVLFGWVDLLVSFGGIAGLFLGFSLLSGLEIVYYFTMRAGCMFVKNREMLYRLYSEKNDRPRNRFDLSLQFKKSRSRSMTNIRVVQPVDEIKPKDGRDVADKIYEKQPLKIGFKGPYGHQKYFIPRKTDIFHPTHVTPYASKIKQLDKNFKARSHDNLIFYGYLP